MISDDRLVSMAGDNPPSRLADDGEWFSEGRESSPERIKSFEIPADEADEKATEPVSLVRDMDVYRELALEMRVPKLGEPPVKNEAPEISKPVEAEDLSKDSSFLFLQVGQGIAFVLCIAILVYVLVQQVTISLNNTSTWFLIIAYLSLVVMQVYTIIKYGFANSFYYLKVIGQYIINHIKFS